MSKKKKEKKNRCFNARQTAVQQKKVFNFLLYVILYDMNK